MLFTLKVIHLSKNQDIKKILRTSLAILMCNRKNFSDSSYLKNYRRSGLRPSRNKGVMGKMLHRRHFDIDCFKKIILYGISWHLILIGILNCANYNNTGLQGFVVEKLWVVSGVIFDVESESGIRITKIRPYQVLTFIRTTLWAFILTLWCIPFCIRKFVLAGFDGLWIRIYSQKQFRNPRVRVFESEIV